MRLASVVWRGLMCASVAAWVGCAGDQNKSPQVQIGTAPLTLPGVVEVCFELAVYNGVPGAGGTDTVWSNDDVCSGRFGNGAGGDISYVGPCDASVSPAHNYVQLVLSSIEVADGEFLDDQESSNDGGDPDFDNPCPSLAPCMLDFECVENKDVQVEFNLTIMRDAEQGFFDIAVNFGDVFCSGKVDSCGTDDEGRADPSKPIELLFDNNGARQHTAVAALACTVGPDTFRLGIDTVPTDLVTELVTTEITVTCRHGGDTVTFQIDPANRDGGKHSTDADGDSDYHINWGLYYGAEQLDCGTAEYEVWRVEGSHYFYVNAVGGIIYLEWNKTNSLWDYYGEGGNFIDDVDGNTDSKIPIPPQGYNQLMDDVEAALSCNKNYLNIAYNIEDLASQGLSDCTLSMAATAREAGDGVTFNNGRVAQAGATYGAVNFLDVPLTSSSGAPVCGVNPLGGDGAVQPGYIGPLGATNPWFCYGYSGGGRPYGLGTDVARPLETLLTAPKVPFAGNATLLFKDIGLDLRACGTSFSKPAGFIAFAGSDFASGDLILVSETATTHVGTRAITVWARPTKSDPFAAVTADGSGRYLVGGSDTVVIEVRATSTTMAGDVTVHVNRYVPVGD